MLDNERVDILLVEDSPTDAELALRAFKKNRLANNVTWVKDGEEALDVVFHSGKYAGRLESERPTLILLDLKLPKIDGIEVLERIKSDPRTRTIPVVILTSSAENSDIVESYDVGVNSYLVKPIDFDDFIDVVSKVGLYWTAMNRVAS